MLQIKEKTKKSEEKKQEEIRKRINYYEWLEVRRILLEKWIIMCPKPPYSEKPKDLDKVIEAMKEKFGNDIIELLEIEEIKRKDVNLTANLLKQK